MYYIYFGTDTIEVRKKAFQKVATFEKKGFSVESIDADTYEAGVLADIAGATSLFGGETLYVIDTPSAKKDMYEDVVAHLSMLGESQNTFIVIEGSLLAAEKKKFQKHAAEMEEVKGEKAERFNVFGMADALARKDKKMLWVLLQEARMEGLSPEEIIGTLWWQLKSLRLAAVTKSASEAGMKDFPYNKAKRALTTFKDDELEKTSQSLLSVYHDGHLGKRNIELALEKWVLSL